jgi:hypothetical protein
MWGARERLVFIAGTDSRGLSLSQQSQQHRGPTNRITLRFRGVFGPVCALRSLSSLTYIHYYVAITHALDYLT